MRTLWIATAAVAGISFTACNNIEIGLSPQRLIAGDDDCVFSPGNAGTIGSVALLSDRRYRAYVSTTNVLSPIETNLSMNASLNFDLPNRVTPLRFDYRWECEASAFALGGGALVLPEFSSTLPFCFDNRAEGQEFVGFDVVAASGGALDPGDEGIVRAEVVSPVLADAMRNTFGLAGNVEACCREAGVRCDQTDSGADRTAGACGVVQILFDQIAPNEFDVTLSQDLNRFRVLAEADQSPYLMRINGRFEGMTADGDLVTSTLWAEEFEFIYAGRGVDDMNRPIVGCNN